MTSTTRSRWTALLETFCRRAAEVGIPADPGSPVLLAALQVGVLAAHLAGLDSEVIDQERAALEKILCGHLKLPLKTGRLLAGFVFSLPEAELPGQTELLTELSSQSLMDRLILLDGLFGVASADQVLHRGEVQYLERIAYALQVPQPAFQELLRKWGLHRAGTVQIPLGTETISLGRAESNTVCLPTLSVSTRHAELVPVGDGWELRALSSASGTWVNGRRIQSHRLAPGDRIRIENYQLQVDLDDGVLILWDASQFTLLSGDRLSLQIGGRFGARLRRIIDNVSASFTTGEFIALMGPSGCGKTTLLNLLLGNVSLTSGRVLLNGQPCPELARRHTTEVGIVPQDDIVYASLTVEESLYFSGCLRSVPGVNNAEIGSAVDRVIEHLALRRIRGERIGDAVHRGISGGERKRVNLGQELLHTSTRFLALDEPTTGLDPYTSMEIFRLLRRLTDEGRLVLVVTHQVDEETLAVVDKVLILGTGGRLTYLGPPTEALPFLGVGSMSELFLRLQDPQQVETWAERYRQSKLHEQHVRLPKGLASVPEAAAPDGPAAAEAAVAETPPSVEPTSRGAAPITTAAEGWRVRLWSRTRTAGRQLSVLTRRYFRVKVRDTASIAVALGQVPLIVLGCWLVLRNTLVAKNAELVLPGALPFILVISAFWLGCANSVREIVTDQAILSRERLAGLRLGPYVGSKLAVLLALTAVQCLLLAGATGLIFGMNARHVDLLRAGLVLGLVGFFGMALGLCVSAACRSSEAAVTVLPGLVIPQLLFGGLLVPFDQMPAAMEKVSYLVASRWGMNGLVQSGASGVDRGFVERSQATLFTVPGGSAVPRDWFLKLLGLARQEAPGGLAVPQWEYHHAVIGLGLLVLAASLAVVLILKLRRV